MRFKALLALLLVSCILLPAQAQTQTQTQTKPPAPAQPASTTDDKDDVVRITTNLVQVDAVVTRDGKTVPNLTADDFEIYEDGRKQTISNFAYVSNVPTAAPTVPSDKGAATPPPPQLKRDDPHRTIAIVVDDLGLSAESMSQARRQVRKFVAEELQPTDLVAIMRTSGELGALQQFTNDKRILNRAVDQMRWNICSRVGVSVIPALRRFNYSDDEFHCGGTSYFQSLKALRFILDAMGQLPGRKSMILLSDSVPRESQEVPIDGDRLRELTSGPYNYSALLSRLAEKAIRASVVIYSIDTQGLVYTGLTAADPVGASSRDFNNAVNNAMSARSYLVFSRQSGSDLLARQTGGFQIRNSNSFQLDRILDDQSGYYLLGYRPTDETFNKEFHHIKAKVKRSGMTLRTRFGFFGVSEEEAARSRPSPRDLTNLALASPFAAQDIQLNLTSFFTNDRVAGSVVRSFVYIGAKDLTFTKVDDRHQSSIALHGAIFGDNGSIVEQVTRNATLNLSDTDYETAMRNGMALTFDVPVKRPGGYQIRVAARDQASSRIGSSGQFVTIPNLNNKRLAVSGLVLGNPGDFAGPTVNVSQAFANPAPRFFEPGSELHFAYLIYNATENGAARDLLMQARLFRDGKNVYSGPETPIETANQTDPNRVFARGMVRLSPDLEPGNYYLEIEVNDKASKGKENDKTVTVQWISFEIAK